MHQLRQIVCLDLEIILFQIIITIIDIILRQSKDWESKQQASAVVKQNNFESNVSLLTILSFLVITGKGKTTFLDEELEGKQFSLRKDHPSFGYNLKILCFDECLRRENQMSSPAVEQTDNL
jgi:hypothetical protein